MDFGARDMQISLIRSNPRTIWWFEFSMYFLRNQNEKSEHFNFCWKIFFSFAGLIISPCYLSADELRSGKNSWQLARSSRIKSTPAIKLVGQQDGRGGKLRDDRVVDDDSKVWQGFFAVGGGPLLWDPLTKKKERKQKVRKKARMFHCNL